MKEKYYEDKIFENIVLEEETIENCEFKDCTFKNCTFFGCILYHSRFSECIFIKSKILEIKGKYSEVKFLEFDCCEMTGINWEQLSGSGSFGGPIERVKDSTLRYNSFNQLEFLKFDFSGNNIIRSTFADCNLREAIFTNCNLSETEFFRCDIKKANFKGAEGYKVDVPSCNIKNAIFSLPEAVNLLYSLNIKIDQ